MSETASSTGTPTTVATYTDISGPQASCMLPVLPFLMGPHMNFIGGLFLTKIGLSVSKLSFLNMTTGRWSATSFTNAKCAIKDTSIYSFSTPLSLHNYVAFFNRKSILHSHIILDSWCHIKNWYCNNWTRHLCATWLH